MGVPHMAILEVTDIYIYEQLKKYLTPVGKKLGRLRSGVLPQNLCKMHEFNKALDEWVSFFKKSHPMARNRATCVRY